MRSLVIENAYGIDNITLTEQKVPVINEKDVLVRTKAISLNQLDLMIAKGAFGTLLPHVLGSDAVGVVAQIGSNVSALNVGDKVSTHFIKSWKGGELKAEDLKNRLGTTIPGVFAEYLVFPQDELVKMPANLTFEEAATLPIAGLTAWEALVNTGKLSAGQTVLLQGTGGVSIFALQFAKVIGARVIIISSSDTKLERAKQMGADETINYQTVPDWQDRVLELTGGNGVDLALEMSWADIGKTLEATKLCGKVVVVGLMGGANVNLSVFGIMQKSISVLGIQVGSKSSFEDMNRAIEVNDIHPVIDSTYNLDQFATAFQYFDSGKHFGKVVVSF